MLRRTFLKSIAATAAGLLLPIKAFTAAKPKFPLGDYVSHQAENIIYCGNFFILGQLTPYYRYVQFPTECRLNFVTKSSDGAYCYWNFCAYNVSANLANKICCMSIKELASHFSGREFENYKFTFADNYQIAYEFGQPEVPIEPVERVFKLCEVQIIGG